MHLYLIGYRGSGKSTVGKRVAALMGCPVIDTDEVIELTSGMTIKQIFEAEGEPGFRDRETQAIRQVALQSSDAQVIALGGGAVLREENQALITRSGRCVWLQASAETLFSRISSDQSTQSRRPNLSQVGGFAEVSELLRARTPVYQKLAEKTVLIEGRTPDEIASEIVDWVNSAAQCNNSPDGAT